jgi:hypothetical protein
MDANIQELLRILTLDRHLGPNGVGISQGNVCVRALISVLDTPEFISYTCVEVIIQVTWETGVSIRVLQRSHKLCEKLRASVEGPR